MQDVAYAITYSYQLPFNFYKGIKETNLFNKLHPNKPDPFLTTIPAPSKPLKNNFI